MVLISGKISITLVRMFQNNCKMKLLSFVLFLFVYTGISAQSNKIALIVAISKYPANSGWGELSSINDVKLIKEALMKQGFKSENIAVVTDKQATLAGMKEAFDKYLIQRAKPGDVAVFHFSGHGQQIEDDNGDEADGLDESIIPYDAPLHYRPGADNHFRDDLLGEKLAILRTKLGEKGNLLVIIDACHSGTMTRGIGRKRGTNEIYASPAFKTKQGMARTITDDAYNIMNVAKGMCPMACFFASSPEESNQEAVLPDGSGAGSLSLAFSRAVTNAEKTTTYRGLFDNIKVEMSSLVSRQTPLAEGDLDYMLFGGKGLGKPSYYTVTKDTVAKTITIPVGKIYGIFASTTLKLYKPDTRDTANAVLIARATITDAGEYSSDIKLDRQIPDNQLKNAWVYLDQVNFGDLGVKIKVNVSDPSLNKEITELLGKVKQVSLVDNAADLFVESGMNSFSADSISLVNSGEMNVLQVEKGLDKDALYNALSARIADYARSKYLRNLSMANNDYKVTVEFVPLKCIANCSIPRSAEYADGSIKQKADAGGNVTFHDGDKFRFNITNHSDQKILYYTVLDIQPDNVVNVLIPGRVDQAEEFRILQGQTVKLEKIFTIGPPYGTDVIKVIASDVPLDMRSIFERKALTAGTRGGTPNPFETLVAGTFKAEGNSRRGPSEEAIQPDAVNIVTLPYNIKK